MTEGSLADKIILYTLPLAATGILQQLFNAADVAVVGRFVGNEAMAAVGSCSPVLGLLVSFFIGISLGSTVVIANAIGQQNKSVVSKAVHTSIVLALIGGVCFSVMGEIFAPRVITLLSIPDEVFPMSLNYLRIYLLGMPVIFLYNFEAAIFRSCGDTKTPLLALVFSGILNVGLNLVFVLVLNMDVDGVATATVISNLASSVILFIALLRTDRVVRMDMKRLGINGRILAKILRIGVPAGVQSMIFSLANIVIQGAVNSLGTTVMAASAAAFNLEVFANYVLTSFGQACTTFVGQNYGAGKADRCRRTLKLCIIISAVSTATVCLCILFFHHPLLSIFTTDEAVIATGLIRLEYIFFAYIFSFQMDIYSGYLRGFGVSAFPALCSIFGICGVRLLWIYTVFTRHPSFATIMQVYPVSISITAFLILTVILILRPSKRYIKA